MSKPKTKKPKTRQPKATEPEKKTRNVRKDTPEIIEKALLSFSAARSKVALVLHSVDKTELETSELSNMLRAIRDGQASLTAAHATINAMRNTPWRSMMQKHLSKWDEELGESWSAMIAKLDE